MDQREHLSRLCDHYREHRRGLLPPWFRENQLKTLGECFSRSLHTLTSLASTAAELIPSIFGDQHSAISLFAIGSQGRLEATADSDIDLVLIFESRPQLTASQVKAKSRDFYCRLVDKRSDLHFEHADGIRQGTFNPLRSRQYPVLSAQSLLKDPPNYGRRMQLLFEAKVVFNHDLAERVWKGLTGLFRGEPRHDQPSQPFREHFLPYFHRFWQDFLAKPPAHVTNSHILKLLIHRELALFSAALTLAYLYHTHALSDQNPIDLLKTTSAPLPNKLLRWCELPTRCPGEYDSSPSRSRVEQAVAECITALTEENQRLYHQWLPQIPLQPLPFYTVSRTFILLAQLLLADFNKCLQYLCQPHFRDLVDRQRTDILSWQSSPDLQDLWDTAKNMDATMSAFASVAHALVTWQAEQKILVSHETFYYLQIAKEQRILKGLLTLRGA